MMQWFTLLQLNYLAALMKRLYLTPKSDATDRMLPVAKWLIEKRTIQVQSYYVNLMRIEC